MSLILLYLQANIRNDYKAVGLYIKFSHNWDGCNTVNKKKKHNWRSTKIFEGGARSPSSKMAKVAISLDDKDIEDLKEKLNLKKKILGKITMEISKWKERLERERDDLIGNAGEPIEKLSPRVEMKLTVINQEKLQNFLTMEQETWKGNM